jgi:hypothetical protein
VGGHSAPPFRGSSTARSEKGVRLSLVHPLFHTKDILALSDAHNWSERGVRLAQKTQVGTCTPVGD